MLFNTHSPTQVLEDTDVATEPFSWGPAEFLILIAKCSLASAMRQLSLL